LRGSDERLLTSLDLLFGEVSRAVARVEKEIELVLSTVQISGYRSGEARLFSIREIPLCTTRCV
jgi:hypothetical protein